MPDRAPQTILVVDDEDANRYIVSRHLRSVGFRVLEAATGSEGLARMDEAPDLVILDVKLPDINGREVCRMIKSTPRTQNTIVVHASAAFVSAEDRVQGLECGADGYLTYPLNPSEMVATVRALLRIREAEQRANVAARQLETTFNAINDGVSLLDAHGRIVRCNQMMAAMVGQPIEQVLGQPYYEVVRESLGISDLPPLSPTDPLHGPRRELEVNTGQRWFRVTIDPVLDERGRLTGAVHVLEDITERKRLDEELRRQAEELAQTNRAKDEFLAMLGHELRNPLGPILNSIAVFRERGPADPLLRRAEEVVERQVHHMVRLVDDLLDVSRITRGTIELRRERVDLTRVVALTALNARPVIEAQSHRFVVDLPPEAIWIDADATRVEQVLSNLLTNATKFTEPGGEIRVTVRTERRPGHGNGTYSGPAPRDGIILVRDTGRGIPPEMLGHIFDLFAQVSPTLDRAQGGLGLGLTLVRRLAELHGGTVSVRSDGAGTGAEFEIRFPALASDYELSERPSLVVSEAETGRKRVLIVEDNEDSRETLRDLLVLWGHDVLTAHDGTRGLELLEASELDVALIDIGLPGLSGYEVSRQVKDLRPSRSVRLVALTGYGQPDDRRRALEAGFDDHLVKPLDPEMLRRLLTEG
ncbi:MAG: domain S-box [Armatimonadetes bacterium]|nr:domain S-box [Armatimonadota bacterium]